MSRLQPCLVSLQPPAQSVEDPPASPAQGLRREAYASLPGACRSPHSACSPETLLQVLLQPQTSTNN